MVGIVYIAVFVGFCFHLYFLIRFFIAIFLILFSLCACIIIFVWHWRKEPSCEIYFKESAMQNAEEQKLVFVVVIVVEGRKKLRW